MESAEANYQGVWGNRIGFGQRPALLVIDFLKAYTMEGAPLYAPGVVEAVANTPALLDAAREAGIPVIHTRILYLAENCADGGMWVKKAPVMKAMVEGNVLAEFCEGVEPATGELVIVKQYASAFFGTSLASHLHAQGIDTVVLGRMLDERLYPRQRSGCRPVRLPHDRRARLRRRPASQIRTMPISSISTANMATSSRGRRRSPHSYRRRPDCSLLKQRYEPEPRSARLEDR